jgi:hypothetical protein
MFTFSTRWVIILLHKIKWCLLLFHAKISIGVKQAQRGSRISNPYRNVEMSVLKQGDVDSHVSLISNGVRGSCPKELSPAYRIDLTEHVFSTICPLAFNTLFPVYYSLTLDDEKDKQLVTIGCTSCVAHLIIQIYI